MVTTPTKCLAKLSSPSGDWHCAYCNKSAKLLSNMRDDCPAFGGKQQSYHEAMRHGPKDDLRWDVYIAGSLRNKAVIELVTFLRSKGINAFADWFAAGPEADDYWKEYYQALGMDYVEALQQPASRNVFEFDKQNMLQSKAMVLMLPAGKSGHLELGWFIGRTQRPGYILTTEEMAKDRWDVMYQFADEVLTSATQLARRLQCQHG